MAGQSPTIPLPDDWAVALLDRTLADMQGALRDATKVAIREAYAAGWRDHAAAIDQAAEQLRDVPATEHLLHDLSKLAKFSLRREPMFRTDTNR